MEELWEHPNLCSASVSVSVTLLLCRRLQREQVQTLKWRRTCESGHLQEVGAGEAETPPSEAPRMILDKDRTAELRAVGGGPGFMGSKKHA